VQSAENVLLAFFFDDFLPSSLVLNLFDPEPRFEYFEIIEDFRHQEVKQRPQLTEGVLERRACQQQAVSRVERAKSSGRKQNKATLNQDTKIQCIWKVGISHVFHRGANHSFGACTPDFRDFMSDLRTVFRDSRDFKDIKCPKGFRPDFKAFRSGMDFDDFKSGFLVFRPHFMDFRSDFKVLPNYRQRCCSEKEKKIF